MLAWKPGLHPVISKQIEIVFGLKGVGLEARPSPITTTVALVDVIGECWLGSQAFTHNYYLCLMIVLLACDFSLQVIIHWDEIEELCMIVGQSLSLTCPLHSYSYPSRFHN